MKKFIYLFSMLIMASLTSATFTSCGDDEEDDIDVDGQKVSASDLVGKSFTYKKTSYTDYDDVPYKEEETNTITFNSSTECVRYQKGYDYTWDDGWKKGWYNHTYYCNYTVSGSTITIYDYNGYDDQTFTYTGSSLVNGTEVFK